MTPFFQKGLRRKQAIENTEKQLSNIRLSSSFHEHLQQLRANDTSLTEFYLSYNKICVADIIALADALKHNTMLTVLALYLNQIGDSGTTALAGALKHNKVLTRLYLSENQISVEGTIALADALKTNAVLTVLYLSGNQIGDYGITVLADALKQNRVLTTLKLGKTQIGDEAAMALVDALSVNDTLTDLDLSLNNISNSLLNRIKAMIEANKNGKRKREKLPSNGLSVTPQPFSFEVPPNDTNIENINTPSNPSSSIPQPSSQQPNETAKENIDTAFNEMLSSRPQPSSEHTNDATKENINTPSNELPSTGQPSLAQPNDVIIEMFETRAELESKIVECKLILEAEANDPTNMDLIKQAGRAEATLEQLEELKQSGQFPSIDEMEGEVNEKELRIRAVKSRPEREKIALRIHWLKQKIVTEQQAQQPNVIQKNADILYKAWNNTDEALQEMPNIAIEYLRTTTNDFHDEKRVGRGGFADVFHGVDQCHAFEFAIKRFHNNIIGGEHGQKVLKQSRRELKVLSHFRHDNIVRVLGYSNDDLGNFCIIYEYAAGGSMASLLQEEEGRKLLHWRKRLNAAISVLSALKYLATNDCSHRDLKPENICFTEDLDRVLLIDFGLSRLVDNEAFTHTCTDLAGWSDPYGKLLSQIFLHEIQCSNLTPWQVAPEYKNGDLKDAQGQLYFDERCEIFSLGFVLQSLITGVLPKPADRPHPVSYLCANPDKDAGKWPTDVVRSMADLCARCTDQDRAKRTTIDEALDILLALQNKFPVELSDEQNATIRSSLLVSVPGKNLSKPNGKCRCGRHSDNGLICNRYLNAHFCCNHCFNEHVKKYLGEDEITCREVGCDAYAYTPHQLVEHIDKANLAEHLSLQEKNRFMRDEAHRRRNAQKIKCQQTDIVKLLNKLSKGQEMLAAGELDCPMHYVLVRVRSTPHQVFGRQWKNPLQVYKRYLLYYLCAHDRTKINYGIELKQTKKWVKKVAPALKISFLMVRIGLKSMAGIEMPFPDWLGTLGLDGAVTEEELQGLQEGSERLEECLVGALDDHLIDDERLTLLRDAQKVSHEAYKEMSKIANENRKWRSYMVMAQNEAAVMAWVKNENQDKWRKSGF